MSMNPEPFTTGSCRWVPLPDGSAELCRYLGEEAAVVLPETLEGRPVTRIAAGAFRGCDDLTELILPEGLLSLANEALSWCRGLTAVTLPDSLREAEGNPFAFCDHLAEFRISPDHPVFAVEEGLLIRRADRQVVSCPGGLPGHVLAVPEGVASIGDLAFLGCCRLRSVRLPEGVVSLGDGAFARCLFLKEIRLPETLARMGNLCFLECKRLVRADLPAGLLELGDDPFLFCRSLREITVAPGHPFLAAEGGILLMHTGDRQLIACAPGGAQGDLAVPPGTRSIGPGAFADCEGLTGIGLPEGVTEIGDCAFSGCRNLVRLQLPQSLTRLGSLAFQNCWSLTELTIPAGVTQLGEDLFISTSDDLAVTVTAGSPAEAYCKKDPFHYTFHTCVVEG